MEFVLNGVKELAIISFCPDRRQAAQPRCAVAVPSVPSFVFVAAPSYDAVFFLFILSLSVIPDSDRGSSVFNLANEKRKGAVLAKQNV